MCLEERFWAKVNVGEKHECWLWTAALDSSGYGSIRDDAENGGRRLVASRLSLIFHTGQDEIEFVAAHVICDNPPCCNPHHMKWLTHQQNMDDMINKKRGWWQVEEPFIKDPKKYGVLK